MEINKENNITIIEYLSIFIGLSVAIIAVYLTFGDDILSFFA